MSLTTLKCRYRKDYQLYEGKPCITDSADQCRKCLALRIESVGKNTDADVWGEWCGGLG